MSNEPLRPHSMEDFLSMRVEGVHSDGWEHFLAEEGLELLAAYQDIKDKTIRKALLDLVKLVSAENRMGSLKE